MSVESANPQPCDVESGRRVDRVDALAAEVRASQLPSPAKRRWIRQEAGVSLQGMAKALRVDPMTVWRWEHGTKPRRSHAIEYRRLLDALEKPVTP